MLNVWKTAAMLSWARCQPPAYNPPVVQVVKREAERVVGSATRH